MSFWIGPRKNLLANWWIVTFTLCTRRFSSLGSCTFRNNFAIFMPIRVSSRAGRGWQFSVYESESISYISKETRYRLWWALYSLGIQLCSMTGRPPNMTLEYCTALLPAPHREEDFQEDHVSRFIADDHTRKALLASFISRAFKPDGQGNNQHAEPPHHSAISEGEDDVPRIAF
ncbi:hypothetical protein N7505_007426, partial [Penicillium chrysogenum]